VLKSKKKLLHVIPYNEFIPPKNGGALRCYHLCKELATYFDVTLITLQPASDIVDTNFTNITILNPAKPLKFDGFKTKLINALKYRCYMGTIKGPAEATVLEFYPVLKELSKTEIFDYVLMEHLSSMALGGSIKKWWPSALRIVDQHNVDHLLYKQSHDLSIKKHKKTFNRLKHQESHMYTYADYFLACSANDVTALQYLNKNRIKGLLVPNGTTQKKVIEKDFSEPSLIFCGSLDYAPNKNGLLWFYETIWPKLKMTVEGITFTVIGRNGHDNAYAPLKIDPQINFVGEVLDVTPYYHKNNIAIVPLLEGSGTRLKILEAMSFGLPVVSTSIGAEGINYTLNKNVIIANTLEEFERGIKLVTSNKKLSKTISEKAHQLINNKYQWSVIVEKVYESFKVSQKF
jgi:glycosyltransferase involved in cell wall biosynthesis